MVLPRVGRPLRILGGGVVFDFGNRSAHLGASIFDVMKSRARTQKMTIIKVTHCMASPPQARWPLLITGSGVYLILGSY